MPFFLQRLIRERACSFTSRPDIYNRRPSGGADVATELGVSVPDWTDLRRRREFEMLQQYGVTGLPTYLVPLSGGGFAARTEVGLRQVGKNIQKHKGKNAGRTYTSKYRGVHQTFPTRRWEAQFRRNGKPTSLGCFDHEEEAARAYDKMMLWCELHNSVSVKGGITNFDPSEYENDIHWIQQVTQDELVHILRSDGRRQAAHRTHNRQKRESEGRVRASSLEPGYQRTVRTSPGMPSATPSNDASAPVSSQEHTGEAGRSP